MRQQMGFEQRGAASEPLDEAAAGLAGQVAIGEAAAAGARLPAAAGGWLVLQRAGLGRVAAAGREVHVAAGDLVRVQRGLPAVLTLAPRSRLLHARLPAPGDGARGIGGAAVVGANGTPPLQVILAASGLGAALRSLLLAMHAGGDQMPRPEHLAYAAGILGLLQVAPSGARATAATGGALAALIDSVRRSLADPELSARTIAAGHGISVRQVQRLFQQGGTSFRAYVRHLRLSAAHADLLDPALRRLPVTEIALRWGFSDSAHFSRCFRAAYGCTARSLRAGQAPAAMAPKVGRPAAPSSPAAITASRSSDRSSAAPDGWRWPESR